MANQPSNRILLAWERAYPYALGLVAGFISWAVYSVSPNFAVKISLNPKDVINIVFNIALAATALLFSIYVLAIAPSGGFLERVVGTRAYVGFRQYVVQALVIGAVLFVVVLPFSAATPPESGSWVWSKLPVAVLTTITTAAVLAFYRVAYIFIILTGVAPRRR